MKNEYFGELTKTNKSGIIIFLAAKRTILMV